MITALAGREAHAGRSAHGACPIRAGRTALFTAPRAAGVRSSRAMAVAAALALMAGGAGVAARGAAAASGGVDVSATVVQDISLSLSTSAVSFGTVTPSQGQATAAGAVTVTVRANVPYQLQHAASALSRSGGSETLPPLRYSDAGAGAFADFPAAPATVKSGGPTSGDAHAFDYQVSVPWTGAPPGTYTGTVTYQAIAG